MLEIKRYLMISWRPLHALPIHNIARADVATTMGDIVKRGRVSAGRARAALSSLFAWAIAQGLVEANPVIGTENPDPGVRRERVLSDAELVAIWSALPDKHDYGRIIKLLVLTAARREEVGGMCWTELHDDGTWTVPASRTKNGRAYTLTLPPLAWRIIEDVPRRASNDHLFGESSRGYRNWTEAKRALDKRCGVAEWTVHDLRRTAATGMATLGVQPHIIEAVLNHVSGHKGGIAGIYNRATYAREIRTALAMWADHIASITQHTERRIIPIRENSCLE